MKRFPLAGLCVLFWVGLAAAQTDEQKQATLKYLNGLYSNGGFYEAMPGETELPRSSVRSTNAAIRAIKYFDGKVEHKDKIAAFMEKFFDKSSGGFRENSLRDRKPDVPSTAVAVLALVELDQPMEPYADAVTKFLGENAETFEEIRIAAAAFEALKKRPQQADAWLEKVAKLRNAEGTWGKDDGVARETGSAVALILRLGGKIEHQDVVVKALKEGQRKDGGYGQVDAKDSDLETCYRIARSLHMLEEKPADVKALREFIGRCRNADGGYGEAPGKASGATGTYHAAILLHWLKAN